MQLISFKEYYGMTRGHELDPIYSFGIYARFSGHFFLKFSWNKILKGKKILVPCLDVIMIAFYVKNNTVKDDTSFFGVSTI